MIHQVAIKTLPQEWLWCETWCDDASKRYAKTIDLVCTFLFMCRNNEYIMMYLRFCDTVK